MAPSRKTMEEARLKKCAIERARTAKLDDLIQMNLMFLPKSDHVQKISKEEGMRMLLNHIIKTIPGAKENYESDNKYRIRRSIHIEDESQSFWFPVGDPQKNRKFAEDVLDHIRDPFNVRKNPEETDKPQPVQLKPSGQHQFGLATGSGAAVGSNNPIDQFNRYQHRLPQPSGQVQTDLQPITPVLSSYTYHPINLHTQLLQPPAPLSLPLPAIPNYNLFSQQVQFGSVAQFGNGINLQNQPRVDLADELNSCNSFSEKKNLLQDGSVLTKL